MLSRAFRLSEKKDFQCVFVRGRCATTPLYIMKWTKNSIGAPRFGFVVANTISKKATKRNLIRRRLREAVRRNLPPLFLAVDVVIIAKPAILTARYKDIESETIHSLQSIETGKTPSFHRTPRKT